MADAKGPLADAAALVADGATPDWHALQSAADQKTRALLGRLRTLADIARLHGTLSTAGAAPAPAVRQRCEPGDRWADLVIREHIGAGRFGDVYRAFDPSLDREVALKILADLVEASADAREDLVEEGRLAARVRHPNVVSIYGAKRADGHTGLWMELVRGPTLEAELAARGPFEASALARVAVELGAALAAVHDAGLVHRDVKATNVMRDADGRVVLGDFGTGRLHEAEDRDRRGLAGTPPYLAPEIFEGQPATPQSDIYSLGVLLFRLATGRFPVEGRSLRALRAAHGTGSERSLSHFRSGLPRRLAAAIERALARDPARRFESAAAFAQAAGSRPSARITTVIAAAAGLMAAAGLLYVFLVRPAGVPGGVQVERLHPELQRTHVLRGPAVDGQYIPCSPRRSYSVALCDLEAGELVRMLRESPPRGGPGTNRILPSPDGSRLAYVWEGTSVEIISLDGTGRRVIHQGTSLSIVRWTAGGRSLVVTETGDHPDQRILSELGVDDGSLSHVWRFDRRTDAGPDLSPDGRTIVVARLVAVDDWNLAFVDVDSGEDLSGLPLQGIDRWPRWAPDGASVLFVSDVGGSHVAEVQIEDRRPAAPPVRVTTSRLSGIEPLGFGADGSLYFDADSPDDRSSWIVSVAEETDAPLTRQRVAPAAPAGTMGADWSPDGTRIAYLQGSFGSPMAPGTVVISDVSGRAHTRIPLAGILVRDGPTVRWSPDGTRLVALYSLLPSGPWVLATVDVDRQEVTRVVTAEPGDDVRMPAWAPDGTAIYYRWSRPTGVGAMRRHEVRRVTLENNDRVDSAFSAERSANFLGPIAVAPDGAIAMVTSRLHPDVTMTPRPTQWIVQILHPDLSDPIDRQAFDHGCTALAWSRDGSRLAVATQGGPDYQDYAIWLLDRDGGVPVRLEIRGLSRVWDLSFSPDGRQLLFTDGNYPSEVWRVSGLGEPR